MSRHLTEAEWNAEGKVLFGAEKMTWRFVCPVCKHVAAARDWQAAGAPAGAIAFSCVGRWRPNAREAFSREGKGPCNYAGGGLFKLNPVFVTASDGAEHQLFEFDKTGAT